MRKNMKLMVITCILAILIIGSLGTLAYLTDTAGVTNTFTVGKVDINLTEAKVGEDGKALTGEAAERVLTNEYKLIPGAEYDKDPTMTIVKDSEEAYVRMIVNVHNAKEVQAVIDNQKNGLTAGFISMLGELDTTNWILVSSQPTVKDNIMSFEFRYKEPVAGEDTDKNLPPLFTKLNIPAALNSDEINALYNGEPKFQIVVEGHAIQAMGFEDADKAWAAFDKQHAAENTTVTP